MNGHGRMRRLVAAGVMLSLAGLAACGGPAQETHAAEPATPAPEAAADAHDHAHPPLPARAAAATPPPEGAPVLDVYMSPTCGCCGGWADHMRENGFAVVEHLTHDVSPIKRQHGVPGHLYSCHTAVVDGYVIEGHIPADVVHRFLEERPIDARGIAVAGMPIGTPGMEGPFDEPYDVIALLRDGAVRLYESRP